MRFFFYGTLMDEAVRLLVMGVSARSLTIRPAWLDGWRRAQMRGRHYPVVVPAAGQSVAGLLADGVSEPAVLRLDRFEGADYRRSSLGLRTEAGDAATAWVYVAKDAAVAGVQPWSYDDWRRRHRAAFLRWLSASTTNV